MKSKIVLILTLAAIMLLSAAAPVMASQPKRCITFAGGSFGVPDLSSPPPTVTLTKNGEIVVGSCVINNRFSSLFGYDQSKEKDTFYININTASPDYLTGYGVGISVSANEKEQSVYKFGGLQSWTYNGPTFTFGSTTYSKGELFFGLLITGTETFEITSGPYAGVVGVGTFEGVSFPDNTGIYSASFIGR